MTGAGEPFLAIDLGPNGGKHTFRDLAQLKSWLKTEREFWAWLRQAKVPPGSVQVSAMAHSIEEPLSSCLHAIKVAEANPATLPAQVSANMTRLERMAATDPPTWVWSGLAWVKYAKSLLQVEPSVAVGALAYFMRRRPISDAFDARVLQGAIMAALFETGLAIDTSPSFALDQLLSDWQTRYTDLFTATKKSEADLHAALAEGEHQLEASKSEHEAVMLAHREELAAMKAGLQKDIEGLKAYYANEMALRKPREYWLAKETEHKTLAKKSLGVLGISSIGVVAIVVVAIALPSVEPGNWFALTKRFFVLGLPTAMLTWWLQIVIRFMLSQWHLATDAAERATMVHTYLAMLNEKDAVKHEGHRGVVLTAIFRPANSGLVKGDFAGPTFMSAMPAILNRKP